MNKVINTVRAIIIVVIVALLLVFCFLNLQAVTVNFIFAETKEIPLFIILFSTLVLGAFVGFLMGMIVSSKRKSVEKSTKREVEVKPSIENTKNDLIA